MSKQLNEGMTDLILVYQFIKRLSLPFEETEAYKLGIIDSDGKNIKPSRTFKSREEKNAYGYFDRLVFNVKKLIEKLPGGKSRLASYAAALFLIKESANPKEHYTQIELMEGLTESFKDLSKNKMKKLNEIIEEDAPSNSTGSSVVGTGDDSETVKIDGRRKKTKAFLIQFMKRKEKREELKKKKDFMSQLGL
jgi:hypothetical protein